MIEVRGLQVCHPGGIVALDGIDLTLADGEYVALMGANGSGKTTLVRCLNGLQPLTSGSVRVDGLSPHKTEDLVQIRQRVGMVFQNPDDQLVTTSVETEIAFGLENIGLPTERMRVRVEEMLDAFDLRRYRRTPPHLLSGGERQRVALAAVVALRPAYLLLDEPTALLDPGSREDLLAIIDDLRRDHPIGVLHATQNPSEAARAERLLVLEAGRLRRQGTPQQVFAEGTSLEETAGIGVPFAVRLALSMPHWHGPVPLHVDDLDRMLAGHVASTPFTPPAIEARPPPHLRIRGVHHIYETDLPHPVPALRGIDFDIGAGEVVAITGASGSGKTTLLQHLNGLLRPTRGTIELAGHDVWDSAHWTSTRLCRHVGLVFQFPEAQLFAETIADDVAFGPRNVGVSEAQIGARVAAALAAVQLHVERFGRRSPFHLSGGEKRRAAIAGVLAMAPEVLVLDEPTAGLDAVSTRLLKQIVRDQCAAGRSVVLVTHDMALVAELASRTVILAAGRVDFDGPTRQAFHAAVFGPGGPLIPPEAWRFSCARRRRDPQAPLLLSFAEARAYARSLHLPDAGDPLSQP